jgi:protein-tyrosine phosphatase
MSNVLIVCTANRCRSPIAAALLRQRLPRSSGVEVRSAGFLSGGAPADPQAVTRMGRFGINLSTHRSVQLDDALLDWSDLILTMTRSHVRSLAARDGVLRRRTFTLRDFVARGQGMSWTSIDMAAGAAHLDAERPVDALLGEGQPDDITDPMGRSSRVWRDVVTVLDEQVDLLAAMVARSAAWAGG